MVLTTKNYLSSAERTLENFKKGLEEIKAGTFEYDSSMPKSCVDALYEHKVKVYEEAVNYLKTLPEDLVLDSEFGSAEELSKYYEIVNR